MNFKTLKNGIAAAAIGATTLAGCTAKNANTVTKSVPEMTAQVRASVKEAAEAFQKAQAKFTTDSIAFSNKANKTPSDTLLYNFSMRDRDAAKATKDLMNSLEEMYLNILKKNGLDKTDDILKCLNSLEKNAKPNAVK